MKPIAHVTHALSKDIAYGFAEAVRCDARFDVAVIDRTERRNGHAVVLVPIDPKAAAPGEHLFFPDPASRTTWWCFSTRTGGAYEVTTMRCTCPDYEYRCAETGASCKHMIELCSQISAGALRATAADLQEAFAHRSGRSSHLSNPAEPPRDTSAAARSARVAATIDRDF